MRSLILGAGGQIGAQFSGGSGHRLENVEISGSALTGLVLRGAEMTIVSSQIASIAKIAREDDEEPAEPDKMQAPEDTETRDSASNEGTEADPTSPPLEP